MWIEQRKNGTILAVERYKDNSGKTKRVSCAIEKNTAQQRKIAQKILDSKIRKATGGTSDDRITLGELVDVYRSDIKKTQKESTYRRNYYIGNTIMDVFGKDTPIDQLTARYVKQCLNKSGKEAGTLNELLLRYKVLIRWAYRNDYIKDISFLDKITPYPDSTKREKIQDKFLESNELHALLNEMTFTRWNLFTRFLVLSGVRVGELIALEKADIDFDTRMITINKTYDSNNLVVTSTKTMASTREIYMQDELLECVNDIMQSESSSSPLLFSEDGSYVKYDNYRIYLSKKSKKALNRSITPHIMRHTHASLLLEAGISIDSISRRLGHDGSKITREIYLHITEKLKQKENERLKSLKLC